MQSVLVLELQKKADMKGDADLFKVVANEPASEKALRGCTELGFPGLTKASTLQWIPNSS